MRMNIGKNLGVWIGWGQIQKEGIADDASEPEFGDEAQEINEFSAVLHSERLMLLGEAPSLVVSRIKGGKGLERIGKIINRIEPRTAATKQVHLKTILKLTCAAATTSALVLALWTTGLVACAGLDSLTWARKVSIIGAVPWPARNLLSW